MGTLVAHRLGPDREGRT